MSLVNTGIHLMWFCKIQALFKDYDAKEQNSSTFKALKMNDLNSSTFKVFKAPYEPCLIKGMKIFCTTIMPFEENTRKYDEFS